jgi:hypothetical protein
MYVYDHQLSGPQLGQNRRASIDQIRFIEAKVTKLSKSGRVQMSFDVTGAMEQKKREKFIKRFIDPMLKHDVALKLLVALNGDNHAVNIAWGNNQFGLTGTVAMDRPQALGGKGSAATIFIDEAAPDWQNLKTIAANPDVGLFHELVHARHIQQGTVVDDEREMERRVIGIGKYTKSKGTENHYRDVRGLPLRCCWEKETLDGIEVLHFHPPAPGARYLRTIGLLGQTPIPPVRAPLRPAAALTAEAVRRIARVGRILTEALQLASVAIPFLKTAAQQELLQLMIEVLRTFFPTGHGTVNQQGDVVRGSQRHRFETTARRPEEVISRPFVYDLRLFLSDQDSPFTRGDHRSIGNWASRVHLYTRRLAGDRPQEMVTTAIHEMTHMLRSMFRSFETKFGLEPARRFPSHATASLIDLNGFAEHRAKMVRHLATLAAFLEREANVHFDANLAASIAGLLLEEVLSFVFGVRVGEAMALAEARRTARRTGRPAIGVAWGFVPTEFLKAYIRRHWWPDPALQTALQTTGATAIISNMSGDLQALVSAMEAHVGR